MKGLVYVIQTKHTPVPGPPIPIRESHKSVCFVGIPVDLFVVAPAYRKSIA